MLVLYSKVSRRIACLLSLVRRVVQRDRDVCEPSNQDEAKQGYPVVPDQGWDVRAQLACIPSHNPGHLSTISMTSSMMPITLTHTQVNLFSFMYSQTLRN